MSKRVIYSYFYKDRRLQVVRYLNKHYGWEPIFFHGKENMREWVSRNYPDAVLHDLTAMRKANFDYSRVGDFVPIDEHLINALSEFELNYLNWLEDTTGWNFSFFERRRYYYDVLKYWNTVIHNLKPDLFIAYTLPHLPSDYPLYLLCKRCYNIPVLFLNPIPYLDDKYYCIGDSLENFSSPFEAFYSSEENPEISEVVKKYMATLRSPEPQNPKHITNYWKKLDQLKKNWKQEYKRLFKALINGEAFKEGSFTFKKNKLPWDSEKSHLTYFENFLFKKKLARRNRYLKKVYGRLTQIPNLDKKYVYFAAPYQPEVLSNLYAGVYEDVFLVLDMLSRALPKDWTIYYKEHPNTFKEADKGALMRDEWFYRKIDSYKNVKMIPFEMNTFTLLDNSQAICTVGGTVGWEAVVRGKPALVYGSLWYQSCKSVFTIQTNEDMENAVAMILNGYLPDKEDIEHYAEAIYRACEYDIIILNFFARDIKRAKDPANEMERVAEAFYRAFKKFYGDNHGAVTEEK